MGHLKHPSLRKKDVISTMPEEVITNILHCLPLQDAVKTSILSKDWKLKWTMITQFVFDKNFYDYLVKTENKHCYQSIISRLLFLINGAITKFVLYLPHCNEVNVKDINCWIVYLSKNGIKEFTFQDMDEDERLKLTSHLFSCRELTHLKLDNCSLRPTYEFGGFRNLLSLDLSNISFGGSTCKEFLTQSPLLKILKFSFTNTEKISEEAENRVLASLPRLTTLDLDEINFRNDAVISCVIELIHGFPNLDTLSTKGTYEDAVPLPAACSSEVDFSIMGQLQLLKVTLSCIKGLENEISLIKYLLDCSPLLKKMDICAKSSKEKGPTILMTRKKYDPCTGTSHHRLGTHLIYSHMH
ncbi:F-box domain, Leucine-rich repeat domain, L domain-like protein [Artemisia annua]|uniref:F-box domain, Leucine-rich repeat domain, L domain-like protein n=1 Tax=Artemisia annua TaxID=35608 RepID=A0A2U1P0Q2_ARTAN|nr:F-box domain, Leucine-rich repeat domain, L domain-like protein [Artemisia annua]